jgi:hypothetical protein
VAVSVSNIGASGVQNVSPVVVGGAFPYDGGPQNSQVQASGGTVTLASGAASLTGLALTANSIILFTLKTASGTISGLPYLTAISATAGTATVAGGGSDNSIYNYVILG